MLTKENIKLIANNKILPIPIGGKQLITSFQILEQIYLDH